MTSSKRWWSLSLWQWSSSLWKRSSSIWKWWSAPSYDLYKENALRSTVDYIVPGEMELMSAVIFHIHHCIQCLSHIRHCKSVTFSYSSSQLCFSHIRHFNPSISHVNNYQCFSSQLSPQSPRWFYSWSPVPKMVIIFKINEFSSDI